MDCPERSAVVMPAARNFMTTGRCASTIRRGRTFKSTEEEALAVGRFEESPRRSYGRRLVPGSRMVQEGVPVLIPRSQRASDANIGPWSSF